MGIRKAISTHKMHVNDLLPETLREPDFRREVASGLVSLNVQLVERYSLWTESLPWRKLWLGYASIGGVMVVLGDEAKVFEVWSELTEEDVESSIELLGPRGQWTVHVVDFERERLDSAVLHLWHGFDESLDIL